MEKCMFLSIFLCISFIGNLQGSAPTPERSISLSGRNVMRAITVNDICARAQQKLAQHFPSLSATSGGGACSVLDEKQRKALTNAAEALRDSTATIVAGVADVEIKIIDRLAHSIERILGMGALSPDSTYTQSITHILAQYRQPRGYTAWHRPEARRGDGVAAPVEMMSLKPALASRSHSGGSSSTAAAATAPHSTPVAEDADVCPICFIAGTIDPKDPIISLPCGHEFHSTCIAKWLSLKIKEGVCFLCPKCRAQPGILPAALARLVSPVDLLRNAIRTHNDAQVFAIIQSVKDVNAQYNDHQTTLLHIAAHRGHIEGIRILLRRGADIQAESQSHTGLIDRIFGIVGPAGNIVHPGPHGFTPLHVAAYHNKEESVIELLTYALNIGRLADVRDARGQFENTPLMLAIGGGHLEMVNLLLRYGADKTARDNAGNTLLHIAAKSNHIAIVELLLAEHADVNASNKSGKNPLDYAQGAVATLLRANGAIKGPGPTRFFEDSLLNHRKDCYH